MCAEPCPYLRFGRFGKDKYLGVKLEDKTAPAGRRVRQKCPHSDSAGQFRYPKSRAGVVELLKLNRLAEI